MKNNNNLITSKNNVGYINPELEHSAEEAECVAMCLDDRNVPKVIGKESLSLWGRVEHYARNYDSFKKDK